MSKTYILNGNILSNQLTNVLNTQSTSQINNEIKKKTPQKRAMNLIDPSYELIDPNPNIHELFVLFSDQFFYGALGLCTVEWSKRLKL